MLGKGVAADLMRKEPDAMSEPLVGEPPRYGARRFEGRVVFVTGAARGQGRSHAVRFAEEGADVIAIDICRQIDSTSLQLASEEDLRETGCLVEAAGGRVHTAVADVRDLEQVEAAFTEGSERLGPVDTVVANAALVGPPRSFWEIPPETWRDVIDTGLTGVWHTVRVAIPQMLAHGKGGAIVLVNSAAGLQGYAGLADYVAGRHGCVGLMRSMAQELGPHKIRVNSVHPSNVNTPMFVNPTIRERFAPGLDDPTDADFERAARVMHLLPVGWVEPGDISAGVMWLASDEARYVTGATLSIDAGAMAKS